MKVTNREADQWTRVAHQAAMRKAQQERQAAVMAVMAVMKKPAKPKQLRLF